MTRISLFGLVSIVALCIALPSTSHARMTDYQLKRITVHLDHSAMRKDTSLFDGKDVVKGVPFPKFETYFRGYMDKLKRAIAAWNKVPRSSAAGDPRAKQIVKTIAQKRVWYDAMNKVYDRHRAAWVAKVKAEAKAAEEAKANAKVERKKRYGLCQGFRKLVKKYSVATRQNALMQHLNGNRWSQNLKALNEYKDVYATLRTECAKPQYKGYFTKPKSCEYTFKEEDDPYHWCQAANNGQELLKKFVINYGPQLAKFYTMKIKVGEAAKRDGWLTYEKDITYADATSLTESVKSEVRARLKPMADAIGASGDEIYAKLFKVLSDAFAQVKKEVDETAPKLSAPKLKKHYGSAIAAKGIKKAYPKASVKKHGVKSGDWKVTMKYLHKRGTDKVYEFPDYRYKSGYVLYKIPDDPWCQMRQFTVYEYTNGSSRKYRKADSVKWGYVRFQACK